MVVTVRTGVCRGADAKKRCSPEPWRSKRVQRLAELEAADHLGQVDKEHRINKPKDIRAFCYMAPEFFLGGWRDSMGSSVCVYSADAFEVRLMVTISRSSQPDLHLNLVPRQDGWHCGEARLDDAKSRPRKVCWVFPKGKESFWTRDQDGEDTGQKNHTPHRQLSMPPTNNPRQSATGSARSTPVVSTLVQHVPAPVVPVPMQAFWTQSQGQSGPSLATMSGLPVSRAVAAPSAQGLMLPYAQRTQWPPWAGRPPVRMWFA